MYGAIIGDLAGSIYEYDQYKQVKSIRMKKVIEDNSFYSDDSILTIAILDAILHDQNYEYYLKKYIQDYKNYKPDFKPYFKSAFSQGLIRWSEGKRQGNSKGNGALMRISPVGFMFDNELDVIRNAKRATIPSHNSDEAIDAAVIYSLMIYLLNKGFTKDDVSRKLELDYGYYPFEKFNTTCKETFDNCLFAFFNSDSFEDTIRNTLLMGGDTDTNCAITGALSEAAYGINQELIDEANKHIPEDFKKILKLSKRY